MLATSGAKPQTTWLYVAAIMVLGLYLRVNGVGEYALSADEHMIYNMSNGRTLSEVITFSTYEAHPPLGYFLYHYWIRISQETWFLRSLSLLFGMLTIPLYYAIGNKLNGKMTGICTALFIAVCPGCVVQSYILRNYGFFVLILSLGYYIYLRWREEKKNSTLCSYSLVFAIACITNFTAAFAVATIAMYQALVQFRETKSLRFLPGWLFANFIPVFVAFLGYLAYDPHHLFADGISSLKLVNLFAAVPYHISTFSYLFPDREMGIFAALLLPLVFVNKQPAFRRVVLMFGLAMATGIALAATGLYLYMGTRQAIWVLPFVAPFAGWVLADIIRGLISALPLQEKTRMPAFVLCAAVVMTAAYSSSERFEDESEYTLTLTTSGKLNAYLASLDKTSILISERGDNALVNTVDGNPYADLAIEAPDATHFRSSVIRPMMNTQALLRRKYGSYTVQSLAQMVLEAEQAGKLKGVDKLVFVAMRTSVSYIHVLAHRTDIAKEVISFPDAQNRPTPPVVVVITKQEFFDHIISRYCLKYPDENLGSALYTGKNSCFNKNE